MAGTILISDETAVPMSSVGFDYLVERIRPEFAETDATFVRAIFEPVDEGAMTFITVSEQGRGGVDAVVRATERAYSKASHEDSFARFRPLWDRLLTALHGDSRYTAAR